MFLRENPDRADSCVKMALVDSELAKERHKGFLLVLREYILKIDEALGPPLSSQVL